MKSVSHQIPLSKNQSEEMRGHRHRSYDVFESDSDEEGGGGSTTTTTMDFGSFREEYYPRDAGTCSECYEKASEMEELKRENDDLKAKVSFLTLFWTPLNQGPKATSGFTDVVLVASHDDNPVPVPAHKAVLASRSPVFRAMLENEMEESRSGTIKICDVSSDALCAFVNYLYTTEACLDEKMACDLLVLAEKYQVEHLKTYCEKFMVSKLNWENALVSCAFAQQHNVKNLVDSALSFMMDNMYMGKLSEEEEYLELVKKDPQFVAEMYKAHLSSKQEITAANKDSLSKP